MRHEVMEAGEQLSAALSLFADAAVIEDHGDTIRVLCYTDALRAPNVSITMTRDGFYKSLGEAIARMLPDKGKPVTHLDS